MPIPWIPVIVLGSLAFGGRRRRRRRAPKDEPAPNGTGANPNGSPVEGSLGTRLAVDPIDDRWIQIYEGGIQNAIPICRSAAETGLEPFLQCVATRLFPGLRWDLPNLELAPWQRNVMAKLEADVTATIGDGWQFDYWARGTELLEKYASDDPEQTARSLAAELWPEWTIPPIVGGSDEDEAARADRERWETILADARKQVNAPED